MNNHCDYLPISVAYDLMEKLGVKKKAVFARLCGVEPTQFGRWEKKGRFPQYRLATLRETIYLKAKADFDKVVKALYEE
jgi:hypothetical protein